MTQPLSTASRRSWFLPLLAYAGVIACLLWAFWTTLTEAALRWSTDPSYSHGFLVPAFAVALLWLRRDKMPADLLQPNWLGAVLLAAGIGLRLFGTYIYRVYLDQISLVPCFAGACLLVGGWPVWRWAWPSILFLGFMIPLPYSYAGMMAEPLQRFATIVSTFLLQSLGLPALAEGNVILLSEVEMGIVEACSGLRMLFVFFALSSAFALLIERPIWQKLLIVVSAVPIALASNVLRITATGILHELVSSEVANVVFHDLAGWLMMPLGLTMLWAELKLFNLLWTEPAATSDEVRYERVAVPVPAAPARGKRPWQPARSSRHALHLGSRPGLP
jgi:exosortase